MIRFKAYICVIDQYFLFVLMTYLLNMINQSFVGINVIEINRFSSMTRKSSSSIDSYDYTYNIC